MGKQKPYDVWVDPAKVSAVWNRKGYILKYKGDLSKTVKRPRSTKYQLFDENRCPNKTAALAHASDTGFMSATAPLRQRMAISAKGNQPAANALVTIVSARPSFSRLQPQVSDASRA